MNPGTSMNDGLVNGLVVKQAANHERQAASLCALGASRAEVNHYVAALSEMAKLSTDPNPATVSTGMDFGLERLAAGDPLIPENPRAWGADFWLFTLFDREYRFVADKDRAIALSTWGGQFWPMAAEVAWSKQPRAAERGREG